MSPSPPQTHSARSDTDDAEKPWEGAGGCGEDSASETMSTASTCDTACLYELLGVHPDASDANIRSAFRKASLQVHPDRCPDDPGASARFRRLMHAKDLLLDPMRRRIYDVKNGHQAKRVSATQIWWSDWDTIFGELDAGVDEDDTPEVNMGCCSPENPISPPMELEQADAHPLRVPLLLRQADILIVGATGIMGTLASHIMSCHKGSHTWAIAGRDGRKLRLLEAKFGGSPLYRGMVRLDTPGDIRRAVDAARVVVDLTGPSSAAGLSVAKACALKGRHYVDNTLEVDFSKALKDKLDASAKASGSCMVVHAGDTATIADFGTWALARHFKEMHKVNTRKIDLFEWCLGYCIGGSEHLAGNFVGADTKGVNPFLLGGARATGVREEEKERTDPVEEKDLNVWCLQSPVAERLVVRATCGMLEPSRQYGRKFAFRNLVPFLDKESAVLHLTRSLVAQSRREQLVNEKKVPPVGYGAGERKRRERLTHRVFSGTADEFGGKAGPRKAHLIMQYGPGGLADRYEGAAMIALETAMALVDAEDSGQKGLLRPGWGTPVYHLAHFGFLDRLVARGLRYKIVEGPPAPELLRNIVSNTMPVQSPEAQE